MDSSSMQQGYDIPLRGFFNARQDPELPPGYDLDHQIGLYGKDTLTILLVRHSSRRFSKVYCHRGYYDRALRVPENSILAIENGLRKGLHLHEIDVRMSRDEWGPSTLRDVIVAHDEVFNRVTPTKGRWSSQHWSEIQRTPIVTRRFEPAKNDFASTYEETGQTVPNLDDTLYMEQQLDPEFIDSIWRAPGEEGPPSFQSLSLFPRGEEPISLSYQIDLRGNGLAKMIMYCRRHDFQDKASGPSKPLDFILKGYNFDYSMWPQLDKACSNGPISLVEGFGYQDPWIIIVFYSKPIIAHALQAKGMKPDEPSLAAVVGFDDIYRATMEQVSSFTVRDGPRFIPEIAHSGLGLGYDMRTGRARNPLDGTPITDPDVIFESLVDRAMIQASLDLKATHLELYFSSCTRLCEVRTSNAELVADIKTGRLKLKPEGEKGISTKLRSIHGGLYPQSDLVVADDPLAEIAARTWIDEYAQLDRAQLLYLTYNEWLA